MAFKVKTTAKCKELGIRVKELGGIPEAGQVFEILSLPRLKYFLGRNPYKATLAELVNEETATPVEVKESEPHVVEETTNTEVITEPAEEEKPVKPKKTRKKKVTE